MCGKSKYWVNVTQAVLTITTEFCRVTVVDNEAELSRIREFPGISGGYNSRNIARVSTVKYYKSDSCFKMKTSQCGTTVNSRRSVHFFLVSFPVNQLAALFSHSSSHMSVILLFLLAPLTHWESNLMLFPSDSWSRIPPWPLPLSPVI